MVQLTRSVLLSVVLPIALLASARAARAQTSCDPSAPVCPAGQECSSYYGDVCCTPTSQPASVTCWQQNVCDDMADDGCGVLSVGCGGCPGAGVCVQDFSSSGYHSCCNPRKCSPGFTCGPTPDGCGGTLDCGGCASGQECDEGTQSCCTPTTSCAAQGISCGVIQNNGCHRAIECGTCPAGRVCDGVSCAACAPTTCAAQGKSCGVIPDGCGGGLSCGACPAGQECNLLNVCAANVPAMPAGFAGAGGIVLGLLGVGLAGAMRKRRGDAEPRARS